MSTTSDPGPDTSPADTLEDADHRAQPDPDSTSGGSALIHIGDRLEYYVPRNGWATGKPWIVVTSDGRPWYRITTDWEHGTVERIDYIFGGQQSGSGHQQVDHDLRQPAGRDADDPDPRGAAPCVPAGGGEPGTMPDTHNGGITDYEVDDSHDHPRPFCHIHTHWSYSDRELRHTNHLHATAFIPHPL